MINTFLAKFEIRRDQEYHFVIALAFIFILTEQTQNHTKNLLFIYY